MLCITMKAPSFLSCVLLSTIVTVGTQKGLVISRSCRNDDECGSFGYICGQNQTCYCDRSYMLNIYGDKCVGGVGQKCQYDEHCIEGAFCEHQIRCECKDQLLPSEDGLACSRSRQSASSEPHLFVMGGILIYLLKII